MSTQKPAANFFFKPVDLRSRQSMMDFLSDHFRYDTMGSWNGCTSYAQRIKIHHLGLNSKQTDNAYAILDTENWYRGVFDQVISDFTGEHGHQYTMGKNGRSGGYLVLYHSHQERSQHQSYCPCCGQLNFAKVVDCDLSTPEGVIYREVVKSRNSWIPSAYLGQSALAELSISDEEKLLLIEKAKRFYRDADGYLTLDNRCGSCGAEGEDGRINFDKPRYNLVVMPGKSIDHYEDFSDTDEWDMSSLRNRVRLVQSFDRACDVIRQRFIDLVDNFDVAEETIMVPQQVKRLKKRAA